MINLLPSSQIRQFRISIINNLIVRYIFLLIATLAAIALSTGIIQLATLNSKKDLESQLKNAEQQAQQFAEVKKKAETLRDNLKTAKTIVAKQVNYSKLLTTFSTILPEGVTVSAIAIDTLTINSPHTVQIAARDYWKIIETKKAMLKSDLIATASIENIDTSKEMTTANFVYTFDKAKLAEIIK